MGRRGIDVGGSTVHALAARFASERGIVHAVSNVVSMIVRLRQTMTHNGYIAFEPTATAGMDLPQQHQHTLVGVLAR
eukprot:1462794-Prymnesium_polylepis.1